MRKSFCIISAKCPASYIWPQRLAVALDPDPRLNRDDIINVELKDVADFTSMPVYVILSSFLPVLEEGLILVVKPDFFGEIDLSRRPLSRLDNFNQHKMLPLDLLPDFCIISRLGPAPPAMDDLTRGLIEMAETKKIPIWLVMGSQLYLDIHNAMIQNPGGNIDLAHKICKRWVFIRP